MQNGSYDKIIARKFFTRGVLPYWCVLVLDCATIVLAGMLSAYAVLGGEEMVNNFWHHFYIWVMSLPIFLLSMFAFRSYAGIARRSVRKNALQVLLSLIVGGIVLKSLCYALPREVMPFQPALRAVLLCIVISFVLQSIYRWIIKLLFWINPDGRVEWHPSVSNIMGQYYNDEEKSHRIYLCLAHMSEEGLEKKYVKEAFDTNWVVPLGPNVNAFEKNLEDFVGEDRKVAALSTGTSAVHLALLALGIKPGDEVCVQTFTFCASSHPITYVGATPVFVDSEPDTWNMDPDLLDKAIQDRIAKTGHRPRAIIPVALYGMPYNIERIMEVANKYDIPVIEDAAEGFGSRYKGQVLGSFGRYGVLSFNGNKMITTSGGGALVCADDASKSNILWYATQARDAYPYYQHTAIGYNYRMSNVCAGIGRGQMSIVNDHIAHHRHVQALYEQLFEDVPGVHMHKQPVGVSKVSDGSNGVREVQTYESNFWLCAITLDPDLKIKGQENAYKKVVQGAVGGAAGVIHQVDTPVTDCQPNDNVEALRVYLDSKQIESRPVWKPMHKQPVYKNAPAYLNGVSESIFKVGMCLPAGPYVTDDDVRFIVDSIKEAIVR